MLFAEPLRHRDCLPNLCDDETHRPTPAKKPGQPLKRAVAGHCARLARLLAGLVAGCGSPARRAGWPGKESLFSGQTRPGGVPGGEGNQSPVDSLYPAFANTGFLEKHSFSGRGVSTLCPGKGEKGVPGHS